MDKSWFLSDFILKTLQFFTYIHLTATPVPRAALPDAPFTIISLNKLVVFFVIGNAYDFGLLGVTIKHNTIATMRKGTEKLLFFDVLLFSLRKYHSPDPFLCTF